MSDTPEDPVDIDLLMAIDPLELTKSDLDKIIAYQRKMRVQREAGVRTRKPKDAPASKLDISSLLTAPVKNLQRRF